MGSPSIENTTILLCIIALLLYHGTALLSMRMMPSDHLRLPVRPRTCATTFNAKGSRSYRHSFSLNCSSPYPPSKTDTICEALFRQAIWVGRLATTGYMYSVAGMYGAHNSGGTHATIAADIRTRHDLLRQPRKVLTAQVQALGVLIVRELDVPLVFVGAIEATAHSDSRSARVASGAPLRAMEG
eukprot:COSAG05_NODE_621_length_8305_cov_3.479283_10_plen_185_part_00